LHSIPNLHHFTYTAITIYDSDVCTKYQEAAKIVNLALTGLMSQIVAGAKIIDLCQFGTTILETQTAKLYNKKVNGVPVEKGVAFPVCISVNDIVCNHSPLSSEELVSSACVIEAVGLLCVDVVSCVFVGLVSPTTWVGHFQAGHDRKPLPHRLRAF